MTDDGWQLAVWLVVDSWSLVEGKTKLKTANNQRPLNNDLSLSSVNDHPSFVLRCFIPKAHFAKFLNALVDAFFGGNLL